MRPLRIYLDTSVINFLFHEDVPEFRKITETFFENHVRRGEYAVYVSDVVLEEIGETPDEARRDRLLGVIRDYRLSILPLTEEASQLAATYMAGGAIPPAKIEDARHVAIATCSQMDILLSWNFKHLANIRKQVAVRALNEREGYLHPLRLTTPMEVVYESD